MSNITDGELAALEARMTAARKVTDETYSMRDGGNYFSHEVDAERLVTDQRIAALEKEIKDHAEWAKGQMTNPNSEVYLKLTKTKLAAVTVVEAIREYRGCREGMQTNGSQNTIAQRTTRLKLDAALEEFERATK